MSDLLVLFLLLIAPVSQQPPRPEFEAASVKPGDPNNPDVALLRRGARFTATNLTLKALVAAAFEVRENQVSANLPWLDSAKFSIEAKSPDTSPLINPTAPMLQSLLADRFNLTVHRETKVQDVFDLVVTKNGAKLKPAADPAKGSTLRVGRGQITGANTPLSILLRPLSQQLARSIIDKTGLTGKYDYLLEWTPDALFEAQPRIPGAVPSTPDEKYASIFTSIQEQLGLRLESAKGPVEVIIIDHAEQPRPN